MADMKMGYELEFGSRLNRAQLKQFFTEKFGITLDDGYDRSYTKWILKDDGSIRVPRGYHNYEIASAAMPYDEAMEKLEKIFTAMSEGDTFLTNRTTGLHIGLSFAEVKTNKLINPVILSSILDETGIKQKFGRAKNGFCKNTKPHMDRIVKNPTGYCYGEVVNIDMRKKKLEISIDSAALQAVARNVGKYSFVNYEKLYYYNYLEFRGLGGVDYHKKFTDVKESIEHFVDCMNRSLDWDTKAEWFQTMLKGVKKVKLAAAKRKIEDGKRSIKYAEETILREQRARERNERELVQLTALLDHI